MRKIVSLLTVLVLLCTYSFAQNRTVTGTVRDDKGSPIPFASIKIKNTNSGTSADANGDFSISAKTGDVLVISAVSYGQKEVTVTSASTVSVGLTKGNEMIDEVIV